MGDLEENEQQLLDEESEVSVISNLHTILKPFLLRRLKSDVERGIPPKKEYLIYGKLSTAQHDLYQAILTRRLREHFEPEKKSIELDKKKRRSVVAGQFKEAESGDSFGEFNEADSSEVELVPATLRSGPKNLQNALMQLRKACNHPYLFERPIDKNGQVTVTEEIVTCSGKMALLDQLLPSLISKGHRVLIFSQMNRMLDILADYLDLRSIEFCRIDGSMAQAERSEQLTTFRAKQSSIPVFILTTRAGGLGINLTAADTVIFFDSDWNPQMDLQAQDRVHRIGQTKPVLIYRLAIANSVETRILERANSKRKLEKLVIHQKKFKGRQQYYKDERILLEDLESILQDQDAQPYNRDEGRMALTKEDLSVLLNRSPETFTQTGSADSQAFKVLQESRSTLMDSLQ